MFTDARITAALQTMVHGIDAPTVPLSEIQRKISQPQPVQRHSSRYSIIGTAAAAAALLVVAFPSIAPGFVQSVEARIAAVLQWQPPPPPPQWLTSAMSSQTATLATAQSRVPFKIVPPAGLPADIVSAKILTTSTVLYSKATHSWRKGTPDVAFTYRRADGRSFTLLADQFDPQAGPPPKYMFQDMGPAPDGRPVLVKHEHFAWRNGNQVMTVSEDDNISAREIEGIRVAMGGVALPRAETRRALDSRTSIKLHLIPKP